MNHMLGIFLGSIVVGLLFLSGCGKERTYWPEREYRKHKAEPLTRYDTRALTNHTMISSTH
jgi:hypothetical protein